MVEARKGRARSIKLPALHFESLRVMGIEVPWIVNADVARLQEQAAQEAAAVRAARPPVIPAARETELGAALRVVTPPTAPALRASVAETAPEVPVRADVQSMDLAQLTACVQACQTCALSTTRQHAVPGQGVSQPSLLVIGEAPGEQEDLQGQPFVGPSGQLLDNMLASIGLDRTKNVYIANTIKCRPPGNRNPREDEIQSCMPFLQRQIELLEPDVILTVGLFAAQTLLKSSEGVQALRSKSHDIQVAGRQIPVIVTYHPAYLLRRPADKRLAWRDLKQVWSHLQAVS